MRLNKTTSSIINDVLNLIRHSYSSSILEVIKENKDLVIPMFQIIYDYDMEDMIDTVLYTVYQTSTDDDFDQFIGEFKSWFVELLRTSSCFFNGDMDTTINQWLESEGIFPDDDPFQGEETDSSSDLIPDEIYGDVDPEDVSFLNQLLKL